MRPPDIPEMLIALGVVAYIAWGVYTWMHRHPAHK